jgi:hypothetical protein
MGGTFVERRGASDEVKKAANKLGSEVDVMRKEMDEMCREIRQGFAAANQKFKLMNSNMTVLTATLSSSLSASEYDARYAWSERRKDDFGQGTHYRYAHVRSRK